METRLQQSVLVFLGLVHEVHGMSHHFLLISHACEVKFAFRGMTADDNEWYWIAHASH